MTHEKNDSDVTTEWQPRIVAFLCNWCSYAGADLAGMSRLRYPAAIKIIRVPCSGRVDQMFVLKSFERGADMVLMSGCHPGDCHYSSGNYHARRKLPAFRELLGFFGIDPRRFKISWVSAAEGAKWSSLVAEITEEARALGPFREFAKCPKKGDLR
ncbi:MAG TPA: hydrogenase iron-sulfur subunit [Phycisphaerae bacterium]|nr:hydrogenase iron-sulfur subunit [Phycisphaerae bacterium]